MLLARALPRSIDWRWITTRAAWFALVVLYAVILARHFGLGEWGNDAHAYWTAWPDLYDALWHTGDSFVYSPAFAQAIWPLTLLDWPAFFALWTALGIAALVLLAGPVLAAVGLLVLQPFWQEIAGGNVDIMVGLAIALGFRYPAAWAFVLLTKVTPGIGLLWFAVRREWRPFAIALGTTLGIVAVSATVAPELWTAWVVFLADNHARRPEHFFAYIVIDWPLLPRIALAAAVVTWGALTNRPWTVLVAAFIASPLPTSTRATMLVGLLPLLRLRMPATDAADDRQLSARGTARRDRGRQRVSGVLEQVRGRAAAVGRDSDDREGIVVR